jgi:signal peptidase I
MYMAYDLKKTLLRIWRGFIKFCDFLWNDNSTLSWVLSMIIAFIFIKFIFFPGLSFAFGTSLPMVAVVSGSMEHKSVPPCEIYAYGGICMKDSLAGGQICGVSADSKFVRSLEGFWSYCGKWYEERNITQEQFATFSFQKGFNIGDVMLIYGKDFSEVEVGDVIIFIAQDGTPIIHRVIARNDDGTLQTKGDHNSGSILSGARSEIRISKEQYVGTAYGRVPYVGLVKLYALKGIYHIVTFLR